MTSVKNYDWDAIALAYYGDVPMQEICEKFGITNRVFYLRTSKMDWPRRTVADTQKRQNFQKKIIIQQAFTVLTLKMFATANRLKNITVLDAGLANKEAQTLRTMVALLKDLMHLEKQFREGETQNTGAKNDPAEHLRTSLAKRLAQLDTETD